MRALSSAKSVAPRGVRHAVNPLVYTLIPVFAATLGAAVAAHRRPSPTVVSAIQHFAAGVVFAAGAAELLPELLERAGVWPTLCGSAAGIAVMLTLSSLGHRANSEWSLLAVLAVDILIDGIVLGIAFASGDRQGLLLTLALTVEVLFLALSITEAASRLVQSPARVVGLTAAIAALLPLGASTGIPLSRLGPAILDGLFAFGLMALLYLVTEELLVEAREVEERPASTAMFFIGFVLLVVVEQLARG